MDKIIFVDKTKNESRKGFYNDIWNQIIGLKKHLKEISKTSEDYKIKKYTINGLFNKLGIISINKKCVIIGEPLERIEILRKYVVFGLEECILINKDTVINNDRNGLFYKLDGYRGNIFLLKENLIELWDVKYLISEYC